VSAEPSDDFLSGASGLVFGERATARAVLGDAVCDLAALIALTPWRLARAARFSPSRRVLALAVARTDMPNVLPAAREELIASHHQVHFAAAEAGTRGKFENLNALLAEHPARGHDWLVLIDDDVALPRGFLDGFVFLAERFGLMLAQPAHRRRSHGAWAVTRRRPGIVAHETRFVEIGPVTALRSETFDDLLPFPALRFGWGLDLHWSAVAGQRGWRQGVIDATPIHHGLRRIADGYDHGEAVGEARAFLAQRPYLTAAAAARTTAMHRGWR
jgi:hypothetical protein